jgi:peptidoglycan/xylan/chitin deacetylase (PgdA/CDA1 family)
MDTASNCTIIMFHYVRDLTHSRYPEIKGLDLSRFRALLDTLQRDYAIVTAEVIRACLDGESSLPQRACLLTFDDGYLEHYTEVFPELARRGLSGCFYPPVDAVRREKLLDVNKIHLLLAHTGYAHVAKLIRELERLYITEQAGHPDLPSWETLWRQYAVPSRFDSAEVIFFKRVLQHALPPEIRARLCNALWDAVMDIDEVTAARETYVSLNMLRVMAKNGMHIGSHGNTHIWLDKVSQKQQKEEIDASLGMLQNIYGSQSFILSIAYPYGAANGETVNLCRNIKASFGLTTETKEALVTQKNRFLMPRIDVNDVI